MTENAGTAVTIGFVSAAILIALLAPPAPGPEPAEPRYITIASASTAGAYHGKAVEICTTINAKANRADALRCLAAPTSGSAINVDLLRDRYRQVDLAIVQSDVFHEAKEEDESLIALEKGGSRISLLREALFVIVRADDHMKNLTDLQGKILALDREESGTRPMAIAVLKEVGISVQEEKLPAVAPGNYPVELCDGKIDAGFWVVSALHSIPSSAAISLPEAGGQERCNLALLEVPFEIIECAFGESHTLYHQSQISLQGGQTVTSYGPVAYLATTRGVKERREADIARVVQAVTHIAAPGQERAEATPRNHDCITRDATVVSE